MGLLFDPNALVDISPNDASRVKAKIDWLFANRYLVQHLPLSENLSEFFKRRIGKYRVIYSWDSNPDELIIHKVGLRDKIYEEPL